MVKFMVRDGARVFAMPIRAAIVILRAKAHLPVEKTLAKFDQHVTTSEKVFEKKDVIVDANGHLGWYCSERPGNCVGHKLAQEGYFAFRQAGWVMIVHEPNVEEETIDDQGSCDSSEEPFAA